MAGDVPAGLVVGVGEESAGARDVFFGMERVNLIFGFVAFVGDRKDAKPVDRGSGSAQARRSNTQVIPGEVHGIDDEEERGQSGSGAD